MVRSDDPFIVETPQARHGFPQRPAEPAGIEVSLPDPTPSRLCPVRF
jgi:phage tail protein X